MERISSGNLNYLINKGEYHTSKQIKIQKGKVTGVPSSLIPQVIPHIQPYHHSRGGRSSNPSGCELKNEENKDSETV